MNAVQALDFYKKSLKDERKHWGKTIPKWIRDIILTDIRLLVESPAEYQEFLDRIEGRFRA